ncbi:hypothetical protein HHI36_018617 [Cryptolaemus montrouzieri]|uniref:Myosin tail domain-containing protein n=1 Tax=Cryptolaemus montrouzieri TaxID=559131 RepID=A0ABD2P1D3_9CUCU
MATPSTSRWHPQTKKYEYNYGLGINFYQPMIDYLEDKERGVRGKSPHLPWSNEKALREFDPMKTIKTYSDEELNRLARKTEASAKEKLRDFKTTSKSWYQLSQSVSAATITEKIQVKKTEKKKKNILRQINSIQTKMKDDFEYDPTLDKQIAAELKSEQKYLRGKSAKAIEQQLLSKSRKNIAETIEHDVGKSEGSVVARSFNFSGHNRMMEDRLCKAIGESFEVPLENLSAELKSFDKRSQHFFYDKSKATSIEIEQLNARVVEAETRLKTEVTRIKKKLQIQITELEMSLDTANKTNIDLQKTIKKQSLQLTEIQAHYDEIQRQLQVTLDQLSVSQRRVQALTAEAEEIRGNYESALRGKRQAEQQAEEYSSRINELTTINVNLASSKSKIEQELSTVVADYDEITKELRISDERYQRVQVELKHTVEILHEEQERVVKIEAIKKSLEIEVKNLSVRLEEVEANAIVGGKRIISKLEARLRDLEVELDEERDATLKPSRF